VARGEAFGSATVTLDGRDVGEVEVVAARTVAAPAETGLPSWAVLAFAGAGVVALGFATAAVVVARRPPR
jgi:hypothetical protein